MSKSYANVLKQIESLQAEAEKLRRAEVEGVIDRIREAIKVYGLTAADLGLAGKAKGKAPAGAKAAAPARRRRKKGGAKAAAVAKFGDGQGNTWVGRGKRPQWLRDALAAGKTLADFELK